LVYLVHTQSQFHKPVVLALNLLEEEGNDLVFCQQSAAEFWAVCTRSLDGGGLGLTGQVIESYLVSFADRFRILPEPADLYVEWRRLALQTESTGRHVYDVRIAAVMLMHRMTKIVTKNVRDFRRIPLVSALAPEDVLAGQR
jgi:predicted nucleic acid-binding protein